MRGLSLVGWYHSHPRGPALPSLQDIDSQMDHQLRLQGSSNGFQPCLGIICGEPVHSCLLLASLTVDDTGKKSVSLQIKLFYLTKGIWDVKGIKPV